MAAVAAAPAVVVPAPANAAIVNAPVVAPQQPQQQQQRRRRREQREREAQQQREWQQPEMNPAPVGHEAPEVVEESEPAGVAGPAVGAAPAAAAAAAPQEFRFDDSDGDTFVISREKKLHVTLKNESRGEHDLVKCEVEMSQSIGNNVELWEINFFTQAPGSAKKKTKLSDRVYKTQDFFATVEPAAGEGIVRALRELGIDVDARAVGRSPTDARTRGGQQRSRTPPLPGGCRT